MELKDLKASDGHYFVQLMKILKHFIECWRNNTIPTEEAVTEGERCHGEALSVCKRPSNQALNALEAAESRLRDEEKKLAELGRAWVPPPAKQMTMFDADGNALEEFDPPSPPDVGELTRTAAGDEEGLVGQESGEGLPPVEEFGAEEQGAIEAAQARLAEGIAKLEAATLEAVRIAKGSPTVALRHVANQGLGMSDEDRKSVLADLIARGEVLETGKGRSRKVSLPETPAPCYAGEGGWPGRQSIREKLLWRFANVAIAGAQAVREKVAEELGVSAKTVEAEYLKLVECGALATVDGYWDARWGMLLSEETRRTALEMLAAGHKPAEVAEAIGQPERAVRDLGEAVPA